MQLSVRVCRMCGAYMAGNRWQEPIDEGAATQEAAKAAVLSALLVAKSTDAGIEFVRPEEVEGVDLRFEVKPAACEVLVKVHASGKVHEAQGKPIVDSAQVIVVVKPTTCAVCGLMRAGHYEAILQVRGEKKIPSDKLEKMREALVSHADKVMKGDRKRFISKIEEKPEGLDFYLSSISLARSMAEILKNNFKAKVVETAKLIGQDRGGKRKFRVSVLARLPS
jgi:NMD protein affecting ribosome stability and mRNA decay